MLLREWFQHPNGALPAYEWNFDDVNPPVHVMAALRVFVIDGGRDREFLERVFQKLLINFTWWVNREDADGNNVFSGGFLGLDNISPIDRSNLPEGVALEQADGTAWMAYYALSMLVIAIVLAEENDVYLDMVIKFLEQFVLIARALERQGLYDAEDGFFYDRLVYPSGRVDAGEGADDLRPDPGAPRRRAARRGPPRPPRGSASGSRACATAGRRRAAAWSAGCASSADERDVLLSVINPDELRRTLREFFDEAAFLSPHGLRAVSKRYENNPYTLEGVAGRVDRLRAGRVDDEHVRRQLELARPDLDAGQLPGDPPVRPLPALLRRRLQARVPDRLGAGAHVRRDRAGPRRPAHLDLAPGPGRPPAGLRRHRAAADRPGVEGQPDLQRVLPRRQRRRPRRDAPDRLDGARRGPDPRPAERRPGTAARPRARPPRRPSSPTRSGS